LTDLSKIDSSKHIALLCDEQSFANASAVYSYVLTKHKKVSIIAQKSIAKKFSFLPWYDKLRQNIPSSADSIIEVDSCALSLFDFFQNQEIKINKKMATSMYGALLIEYDCFCSERCNGMVFAAAAKLIELNAEDKECLKYLKQSKPLAYFRLQARLYKNLLLKENATVALLSLCQEDLEASGASFDDAYLIMKEVLDLVHVQEVRLLKKDENDKILKSIRRK